MRTQLRLARSCFVVVIIWAAGWILSGGLSAQGPAGPRGYDRVDGHDAVAGEVIVKYRTAKSAAERAQVNAIVDAEKDDELGDDSGKTRHIRSRRFDAATLVAYFRGAPDVEYAEPNYILYAITVPNDPSFSQLYGLLNTGQSGGTVDADIDADLAWDVTTGSTANVVGVVDTGVNYNHVDLAGNIWSAPLSFTVTIAGQNVTCAAGTHGFRSINGVKSCDPNDDHAHGSHVSGTIGAVGNNGTGVAGVNWTARIMGLKFLNSAGSGSTSDAVNVIDFAIKTKAHFGGSANVRVLSNSWGGGGFSQTLLNMINSANANNMLFVAAAGNNNSNNDSVAFYPSNYNAPNVVSVAATDRNDLRASFSNYGATTVDLGAPGVSILSTVLGNSYSSFSGTSMATPHVSGAGALILAACPTLDTAALKNTIFNAVDLIPSMSGITVTGGRLNVNNSIVSCVAPPSGPPPIPTGLVATAGNNQVALNWNDSAGATSYNVKRSTINGGPYSPLASPTQSNFTDFGAANGITYYYVVSAVANGQESNNSSQVSATPTAPTAPTGVTTSTGPGKGRVTVRWIAAADATSYNVKRANSSSGPFVAVGTTSNTSAVIGGMTSGQTYWFVVSAVNAGGESPNSSPAVSGRAK